MLLALALAISPAQILRDAYRMVEEAKSLEVTLVQTSEEFPKNDSEVHYWWRRGGYFRAEGSQSVDMSNPRGAWTWWPGTKQYMKRQALPASFTMSNVLGLGFFGADFPVIDEGEPVMWHGMRALRIGIDARAKTTKEARVFLFVDNKTHVPIGISANLGSLTQVRIFKNLVIDGKIDDSKFKFSPPTGWKLVKE